MIPRSPTGMAGTTTSPPWSFTVARVAPTSSLER